MQSVNFTFNYTDAFTMETITNLNNMTYSWQKYYENNETVIERGNGTLQALSNNLTVLDFHTEIRSIGYYVILIYLYKEGYNPKNAIIDLQIVERPILINGMDSLPIFNYNLFEGEEKNFTYKIKDKITGNDLMNLDVNNYTWEQYDNNDDLINSGEGTLGLNSNNSYVLNFNTKFRETGIYLITVIFIKENYTSASFINKLTINKKEILYHLNGDFQANKIYVKKENFATMLIYIFEASNGTIYIPNASVTLVLNTQIYFFEEIEEGVYRLEFQTNQFNTFFEEKRFFGQIKIVKEGFKTQSIEIEITIGMEEIFPGMPLFYFLNILISSIIILLGLFLYRYKLRKRK